MPNPLHLDVNCRSNAVVAQPLSDQEYADHQALQSAVTAALQADATFWAQRRAALRALLLAHPELQPLIDYLRLNLS